MSHEYHYVSDIGEDNIFVCSSCQYFVNKVVCKESHCPQCGNAFLEQHTAEVMEQRRTCLISHVSKDRLPLILGGTCVSVRYKIHKASKCHVQAK